MRVFQVPDVGWLVEGDRVEEEPYAGFRLPEPAHEMVQLDVGGRVLRVMRPEVYSDSDVLGCVVHGVRGSELVVTDWRRIDEPTPRRMETVLARGLVEVPEGTLPFRAEVEEALRAR